MDITLSPKMLCGSINDIIASKSIAHRALICAALADKTTTIICNSSSDDIKATVGVLSAMGADIKICRNTYTVVPIKKIPENEIEVDFIESGSTMRFILPILGALGIKAKILTRNRLTVRPLSPLYEVLVQHGMKLSEQGKCPLYCEGKLYGNDYEIDGSVSSQFISGLIFALAINGGGKIKVTTKLESASYVDLTIDMLEKFGIKVTKDDNSFTVQKGKITSPQNISIEGDWSNAAFWLTAGSLSEKGIGVKSLKSQSIQGDSAIIDILKGFGADLSIQDDCIYAKKADLKASVIDACNIPDLVPIISIIASACDGKTVINNISRLRFKESDRVSAICEMLKNLGIETRADSNTLEIRGGTITGGVIDSQNDHRIVMSAAIASCISTKDITILNAGAVNKSYPEFFEKIQQLGAFVYQKEN